jgi:hypothetical protein
MGIRTPHFAFEYNFLKYSQFKNIYPQQIRTFENLKIFVIYLHICNLGKIQIISIYMNFG